MDNPYAPPLSDVEQMDADALADRRAHLRREAELKGLAFLLALGGVFLLLGTLPSLLLHTAGAPEFSASSPWVPLLIAALGALWFAAGWGLRRTRRWSRLPVALSALTMMLIPPVGTLVGVCALYLLLQARGRRVLRGDYADVGARTPGLKPGASWLLLGTLAALVLAMLALPSLAG